jgi:hypothetical protein
MAGPSTRLYHPAGRRGTARRAPTKVQVETADRCMKRPGQPSGTLYEVAESLWTCYSDIHASYVELCGCGDGEIPHAAVHIPQSVEGILCRRR